MTEFEDVPVVVGIVATEPRAAAAATAVVIMARSLVSKNLKIQLDNYITLNHARQSVQRGRVNKAVLSPFPSFGVVKGVLEAT